MKKTWEEIFRSTPTPSLSATEPHLRRLFTITKVIAEFWIQSFDYSAFVVREFRGLGIFFYFRSSADQLKPYIISFFFFFLFFHSNMNYLYCLSWQKTSPNNVQLNNDPKLRNRNQKFLRRGPFLLPKAWLVWGKLPRNVCIKMVTAKIGAFFLSCW